MKEQFWILVLGKGLSSDYVEIHGPYEDKMEAAIKADRFSENIEVRAAGVLNTAKLSDLREYLDIQGF